MSFHILFSHSINHFLFSSLHELIRVCDLQKGESRMEAALDAMKPYGFPNRLVRTAVNSLLKVKKKKTILFIQPKLFDFILSPKS